MASSFSTAQIELNPVTVPEPGSFAGLLALGGLIVARRRRRA